MARLPITVRDLAESDDSVGREIIDSATNDPDRRIPSSAAEWYQWLVLEEKKTVAAYCNKPALLIADYRRDKAIARDYEGREILELLQNANDQSAELGIPGRVLLELSPEALIVANTGLAFSLGGVASLQTSHYSPKRRNRRQLIGNKGLGFRSVLNWSKTPIILSNTLSIGYGVEHAKNKLTKLCSESTEIARLVQQERQGSDELILPLLPFPLYSANADLASLLVDGQARKIYQRCEELLLDGYDTVIGMPFETPSAHTAAAEQIEGTRPEILLFAQHLWEIRFSRNDCDPVIWQRAGSDEVPEVLANGKTIGKWKIHRTTGELPASAIEPDQLDATYYEIAVAVPIESAGTTSPLFSHFPTNVTLPLPLVCHATLELEQNRKHLQEGRGGNSYVLERLGEFLCEIAEGVAAQTPGDPWAGCSMLMSLGDYPDDLLREHFPERLIEFAKVREVVPTLSGKAMRPEFARIVPGADSSWLPPELFPNVVPIRTPADHLFLESLRVLPLGVEEIKNQIFTHDSLSVDRRVALICGLLDQVSLREVYTSALFIDTSGRGLFDGMRVFLTPSTRKATGLPEWADLRFLNEEMRDKLGRRLGISEGRELQQELSRFGLLEYSLANVIRALVAEVNRVGKADPEKRVAYQADLLRTVFELHIAERSEGTRPDYPDRSQLHLQNQNGDLVAANTLYLAHGFGPAGEISQALYGHWAPEKLVDQAAVAELTKDQEKLRGFLQWIGVAQWPRSTEEEYPDSEYLQHVLRRITFPAMFGEKVVTSADDAYKSEVSDIMTVEGLDDILQKSEPGAIAAWLANDERALAWSRDAADHAKLKAYPNFVIKAREYQGVVPSYVRWRLETSPWLRSADGTALRPKDCVLGERAVEELFPRPAMPDSSTLKRYGAQQLDVLEGWRRAGVLTSLAYLERDEIYSKLLELPRRDPDGKLARPLYHWLLDASDFAPDGDGPNQKEFLNHGEMWGRDFEGAGYIPIAELHHADVEGLPDALLQKLKIVDLRKRIGPGKVERVFGVRSVDRAGIRQRLVAKDIAMGSSKANKEFQAAKPYLHKLRTSQTSQLTQLQALKDLQLEVCSTLRAELTFEGVFITYDVPVWGWLIDEKTLHVRSDPARPMSFSDSLLADSIGEALASVFRIADGGDFARMLVCKEEDRAELLRRLRGESALEDIESIKAEFEAFHTTEFEARFPVTEPPEKITPSIGGTDTVSTHSPDQSSPETTATAPIGPLVVVAEEHVPRLPAGPRTLQVKTVTHSALRTASFRRVTDGEFCERKAMEFEEADSPPRWPLAVGQIMGTEGPHCDVLSFASEADREAFRKESIHNYNTVIRFIEVKGRGSVTATIELKGNELAAADRYGERYYLYRLFEVDDGTFELMVLQNPLIHKESLQPAVHVGIERAAATQRFSLMRGLRNNAEC